MHGGSQWDFRVQTWFSYVQFKFLTNFSPLNYYFIKNCSLSFGPYSTMFKDNSVGSVLREYLGGSEIKSRLVVYKASIISNSSILWPLNSLVVLGETIPDCVQGLLLVLY